MPSLVQVPSQVLDPETEVEVLIMAYHSYVQAHSAVTQSHQRKI